MQGVYYELSIAEGVCQEVYDVHGGSFFILCLGVHLCFSLHVFLSQLLPFYWFLDESCLEDDLVSEVLYSRCIPKYPNLRS